MNRYEDADKKGAPTPEEARTLLERLRPIVYADGKCEACIHSGDEKRQIADVVLRWWLEANIDGFVAPDGSPLVPSESGDYFEPRPAIPESGHGAKAGATRALADEVERPAEREDLTCIAHGLWSVANDHPSCPVVVDGKVCPCECLTCKRAWWEADRPRSTK